MAKRSIKFTFLLLFAAVGGSTPVHAEGPPADLLCANLETQPIAAHVIVRQAAVTGKIGALVTYLLTADIRETFRGHLTAGQRIRFHHGMERDAKAPRAGTELVVFLEPEKTGGYRVPDPSFAFPATKQTLAKLRACQ